MASSEASATKTRVPKVAKVKNKAPAPVQITAEQLLREAKERQLELVPAPPKQKISDPDELQEYKLRKRKAFEDNLRKNRSVISNWLKYAQWEESQREIQRARSIYERALDVDHRNITIWLKYAEMEMKHRQINHARNIWDRAVTILPRVNQFWYKYTYMEEMLSNVAGARQIFERWMEWEPDEQAWHSYINVELRYKEIDRARSIYERYVMVHPEVKNWVKFAKFEERQSNIVGARDVYERAVEFFGEENADEKLFLAFGKFEENCKEHDRVRVIFQYALQILPKEECQELYKAYTQHEKKYGDKGGIEDVIVSKRKFQYEEEVKTNPNNYDAWFDYLRLMESESDPDSVREVYERAIANVPPAEEKRLWRRYIYLWINYALYEELIAKDMDRTRQVYRACLELIPHKKFTFGKVWLLYAQFEIRQKDLKAARQALGTAIGKCPKDRLFREYIGLELQLREFDRCRKLYEKFLEFNPANCTTWVKVVELLLASREVQSALANGKTFKTDPPLHLACKTGHLEIVRMLLEADADINQATSNGSCLHEAALYGKTDVVKFLLDWGIDVNIRNDEGHTALDVVNLFTSSKASADIKQLLKDAADADTTVYAKAVRDHFNMMDSTALSFKTGETIIVLEQNQNERWKGKVKNGDKEKVGYFPGNFVRLTALKKGSSAKKSPKLKEAGALPVGSYQMVALPSVPPSPGFQRNSPRLSSFGKNGSRHRGDGEESPSPSPKKALFEPVLPAKGLQAKKGSVKLASGPGLQYVEVEVDKAPLSPPQAPNPGVQTNSKTQYAEVRLPSSTETVEEVDECEELPQLPEKENKKPWASNVEMDDIWVRNTSNPPPSLPPKIRAPVKGDAPAAVPESSQSTFTSERPPAALPQYKHSAEHSSPEGQTGLTSQTGLGIAEEPSRRVGSPKLSRKGYEKMSLKKGTPASTDVFGKPQPLNVKEYPKPKQELAYENVQLPNRGGKPANDMQSMIISDVDQQGEGEDGYVIVSTLTSKPTDARGYENVTPGASRPVKLNNNLNDVSYVPMTGAVSADSAQNDRTSNQAPEQNDKTNLSDDAGETKDGMDYEMMTNGAVPVKHQYVNIDRRGNAGDPLEATGHIPLKMRDYNDLFDWLEKFRLTIYIDNFAKGGFDMTSVLGITAEDLTAINVTKTGHRKKILSESAKLESRMVFPKEKPKDIMTWLRLIGLQQYIPEFLDGGFDDMDFLQDMTLEDLVAIGVKKPGHQRKIWMAVQALKEADENENVLESVEEELTSQERKGYLETCLDGEDSGVSTDEVEPSELISERARTQENQMEFSGSALAPSERDNEEPFVEDSSSAESEIPETTTQVVHIEKTPYESGGQDQQEDAGPHDLRSEVPQTDGDEVNPSANGLDPKEKDNHQNKVDASLGLHGDNAVLASANEDDEPPPRPPPPVEDIDLTCHEANPNRTEIDFNGPGMAVKDMVSKENERIRTSSLDSTFQRPKKPAPPPPVKPKSFKKGPPPKVPPKPRKSASFTAGYSERSSSEESCGDRSPTKSLSPVDRRSSTGSSPYSWPSPPPARQAGSGNGSGSVRSRSSSASSHSSVESLIEEIEERRKSFERPGRKVSAPDRLNTSYEYHGGVRTNQVDATRADGELDEQIKQILRNRSREDLSEIPNTEPSVSPSPMPQVNIEAGSLNTEAAKKEQELAEDLLKDINNMLNDFSTELDSMFE